MTVNNHTPTILERFDALRLAPMRQTSKESWTGSDVRLADTKYGLHLGAIKTSHDTLVNALQKIHLISLGDYIPRTNIERISRKALKDAEVTNENE